MNAIEYGGEGQGFLLLHGLMARAFNWDETASWLVRHGRVVATDAQGHGGVPFGEGDTRVADTVAAIERYDLAPAIIVGHSMGGITAWQVAAERSDLVKAIVTVDSGLTHPVPEQAWRDWFASWPLPFPSRQVAAEFFGREFPGEGRSLAEVMVETPGGLMPHFDFEEVLRLRSSWSHADFDGAAELSRVDCPALLIKGERSALPREELQRAAKAMKHGAYAEVADAGHVVHFDNPAGFRRAVEAFLTAVGCG